MSLILSPNMSLPVPQVGSEAGPDYAFDINDCLSLIDSHDHTAGSGVQITPSGLNINSDLTFNGSNAINLRSVRMSSQGSPLALPSDLNCLNVVAGDLYFNDGLGNQVQITANGAVAGTPGSIANLVSPASASYVAVSSKFVFQSDVNTAASLDARNLILRNSTASSNGLTLSPPNSLASNYTITLPTLPAATNILMISSGGAISSVLNVDNSTIEIMSNNLQVKDDGITFEQLAPGTIINRAYTELTSVGTTTALIPTDDTIPQNTEGTQIMTCAITPKLASSKLRITVIVNIQASDTSSTQVVALFRDSTASAVAACMHSSVSDGVYQATLTCEIDSSAASATTFKVRVGTGSATMTWNGSAGSRTLGGVMRSTIVIEEIKV